jgi:hypothetical protein
MAKGKARNSGKNQKKATQYTYDEIKEPRTPETGHTPLLPADEPVVTLQRNEIVSESRIAQIIERARKAAEEKPGVPRQGHLFANVEKTLRETERGKCVGFYTREEGRKNKLICGDALFDCKRCTTDYKHTDSGYVSAWYLDEDYDGDCFVDCQMFSDFKKTLNIKAAIKAEVDPEEFTFKLDSEPFPVRGYRRIAG